ncbi:MAG: S8 family serine peptidase, partial [Halobacteriota archaeon]|nr:S8 family serine peptidase [Halobacteriota archaeon]
LGYFDGNIDISLSWDDWDPDADGEIRSDQDYDIHLYKVNDEEPYYEEIEVENSRQDGTTVTWPFEKIAYNASEKPGEYAITIERIDSERDVHFELYSGSELPEHNVEESSLTIPADAEGAMAVGATGANFATKGILRSYSSRGPTNDNRPKPDVVAPSGVRTSVDSDFGGTSSATPHVAGAAALLLDYNPTLTNDELQETLENTAKGSLLYSENEVGSGRIDVYEATKSIPLFDDDFERYSYGDFSEQMDMWTEDGSFFSDNWMIQEAPNHGNVLGVRYANTYPLPLKQLFLPIKGEEWRDYTWEGEFRYANDFKNIGVDGREDEKFVGCVARFDDDGAYVITIDMDERGSDGNIILDEDDEFWVSIWNLYDLDGDGDLASSINHENDVDDEAFLLAQKKFTENEHEFAEKLLNQYITNDWFKIKMSIEGEDQPTINVWLDGVHVFENVEDTTGYPHKQGRIGWYLYNSEYNSHDGEDWQFDNVVVTRGCIFQDRFNDTSFTERTCGYDLIDAHLFDAPQNLKEGE